MTVYKPTAQERAEIISRCRGRLRMIELMKELWNVAMDIGNAHCAELLLKEASAISSMIDADLAQLAAREVVGTDRE